MEYATEWPLMRASLRKGDDADRQVSSEFLRLRQAKSHVPAVIAKYGRKEWSSRVDSVPAHAFSRSTREVASRAYHKMHEIFQSCALPFPSKSLHLCEAPGGFVQWVGDHHPSPDAWTWTALSLEAGPQFQTRLLPMSRGTLLQGDVSLTDAFLPLIPCGEFDLVTADGAVEMNHDDIEAEHIGLLFSQTRLALHALARGGTLLIKCFEAGTYETQAYIAQMTTLFRNVSVIKPLTSRATNSERYLVCRHFEGSAEGEGGGGPLAQDEQLVVSLAWLQDARKIFGRLASDQSSQLERVLATFGDLANG